MDSRACPWYDRGVTVIAFRSPVRVPLLRAGTPKPTPPDPRAYDTFRVTQRFDDVNPLYPEFGKHRAVDIGNFRCGDTLVAMAPGVAYRVKDNAKAARGAPSDALGIRIDHGHGVLSEIWHVSQWLVENGSPVNAGQAIASVGATGIGSVCHTHIEIKINGIRIDPEPMMFGQSLTVEDQDMQLPPTAGYFAMANVGPDVNHRDPITLADPIKVTVDTPIRLLAIDRNRREYSVLANGQTVKDDDWYIGILADGTVRAFAKLLTRNVRPTIFLTSQIPLPPTDDPRVAKAIPHVRAALAELE